MNMTRAMSLVKVRVLAAALLVLWFLVQLAFWLWRMPVETARKMNEQRAFKQLEKGLLALTEGDWRSAEKALEKSASTQGRTTAHYLADVNTILNRRIVVAQGKSSSSN